VKQIQTGNSGTDVINIGGGTLLAEAGASSSFLAATTPLTVTLQSGGATLNALSGVNTTIAAPLGGTGALTKVGAGQFNLSGSNAYSGGTTITAGTLGLSGSGQINGGSITINGSGARLEQTSSVAINQNVTVLSGTLDGAGAVSSTVGTGSLATISNGNGGTGSLSIGSLSLVAGSSLTSNIAGGSGTLAAGIEVANLLSTDHNGAGSITLNVDSTSALTQSLYDILGYGTLSGGTTDFQLGTIIGLPGRANATLVNDTTDNALAISIGGASAANLLWTGANSGTWSTGATLNWINTATSAADNFYTLDNVTFDDTSAVTNVTVASGGLSAGAITFNNNTNTYTISGGGIQGGSLTLNGSGTVILNNSNTYAGGTSVNNGTLILGTTTALGSGSAALTMTGGVVSLNGNAISVGTLSGNAGTIANNGSGVATLTVGNGNASGTFGGVLADSNYGGGQLALVKTGSGTLELSGTQTNSGSITVLGGTLVDAGNNTSSGTLTFSAGTTWQLQANANNTTSGISDAAGSTSFSGNSGLVFPGAGSFNIQLRGDNSVAFSNTATANGNGNITFNFDVNNLGTPGDIASGNTLTFDPISDVNAGRGPAGVGFATYDTLINVTGGNGYALGLGELKSVGGTLTINATTANVSIGTINNSAATTLAINANPGSISIGTITGSAADTITFPGTGTVTITGSIGAGASTVTKNGTGTLILDGVNTYTSNNTIASGTMLLNGGSLPGNSTLTVNGGGAFVITNNGAFNPAGTNTQGTTYIGNTAGNALFALNSGTFNYTEPASGYQGIIVGATTSSAVGVMQINGGQFTNTNAQMWIGDSSQGTTVSPFGAVVVSGGTMNVASYIQIGIVAGAGSGGAPQGELVQSGGLINETAGYLSLGNTAASGTDEVDLSGGTLNQTGSGILVANVSGTPTGVINVSGTALLNVTSSINLGSISTATGILNLGGGTVDVGTITASTAGTNLLNFTASPARTSTPAAARLTTMATP
jgi:autotransporter-associated beta strand protein